MRIERVLVEHFQAIERAEVELGRGLNILHGPNDLGKSTLASAIRAVLLLPHASAEARRHLPWTGDHTPRVELTFADASERFWRVTKTFGEGSRGSATLESSKNKRDWTQEARARAVDEKLREVLSWGAAAPGGKSGNRGLPDIFLSHVLLGEQTNVDAILSKSFEEDPTDSGKLRLTQALQALAVDPSFKRVLDEAQKEVDRYFTATGQFKRGKTSSFKAVAEKIKALAEEREGLKSQLASSEDAERRIEELRERQTDLLGRRADAEEVLKKVLGGVAQTERHQQARARLEEAAAAVRAIEAEAQQLAARRAALEKLAAVVLEKERVLTGEKSAADAAARRLEQAKEVHRRATSEEAETQRALERSKLEKALLSLESELQTLTAKKNQALEAQALAAERARLEAQRVQLANKRDAARARGEAAQKDVRDSEQMRENLKGVIAFARFQAAKEALEKWEAGLERTRSLEAELDKRREALAALVEKLAARALPELAQARVLAELEQQLAVAEAAVGGGFSVTVRPRRVLSIEHRADKARRTTKSSIDRELVLEADRSLDLSIPELLDLRIVTGDADQRKSAEALRARWTEEAEPVLARAGVATAAALLELCAATAEDRRAVDSGQKELERLREQLAGLRAEAGDRAVLERQLSEREAALEGKGRAALAKTLSGFGTDWESRIEATFTGLDGNRDEAAKRHVAAEQEHARAEGELRQVEEGFAATQARLETMITALGAAPQELLLELAAKEKQLQTQREKIRTNLAALEGSAGAQAEEAAAAVEQATRQLERAQAAVAAAEAALQAARSERDTKQGEVEAQRAHLESLPRTQTLERKAACEAELAATPMPDPPATEADVERARAAVDGLSDELTRARSELDQAEGALTRVGGAVVRERYALVCAAYDAAVEEQHQLEAEAQAWRLLLTTLQDSESAGSRHLGAILAPGVSRRFSELTADRYGPLELTPGLQCTGIEAAGASRPTDLLSAGTRDQLATLLRLAIAETLETTIILDDHLVQTDPVRLEWFRRALQSASSVVQVIVLTCRRADYEPAPEVAFRDLTRMIRRAGEGERPATGKNTQPVPSA